MRLFTARRYRAGSEGEAIVAKECKKSRKYENLKYGKTVKIEKRLNGALKGLKPKIIKNGQKGAILSAYDTYHEIMVLQRMKRVSSKLLTAIHYIFVMYKYTL